MISICGFSDLHIGIKYLGTVCSDIPIMNIYIFYKEFIKYSINTCICVCVSLCCMYICDFDNFPNEFKLKIIKIGRQTHLLKVLNILMRRKKENERT